MLFKYAVAVLSLAVIPTLGQYSSTNCFLQTVQSLSIDLDRAKGKWFHTTSFEIPDIFRRGDEVWNCTYLELSGNETNGFTAFANLGSKNKTTRVQKPAGTQNGVLTIGSGPFTIPVWVFDTDYSNFAIVMFCGLTLFGHTEQISILSRTPNLSAEANKTIIAAIGEHVKEYHKITYSACNN